MMNEKIKQLAEQSDCTIDGMGYGEGNIEYLIELIVRECIIEYNKYSTVDFATIKIKEHFGIEE